MTLNDRRRALMMRKRSGGRLPAEYQEVEWIKGDGDVIIDLQYVSRAATQIYLEIGGDESVSTTFDGFFIGNGHSTGLGYTDLQPSSNIRGGFNEETWVNANVNILPRNIVYLSKDNIYFNDTTLPFIAGADYASLGLSGYFRDVFASISFRGGKVKIFECKISESNVDLRHLVPCYRKSDGVIGMYDLCGTISTVTGTPFFPKAFGSGAFTKGADVV